MNLTLKSKMIAGMGAAVLALSLAPGVALAEAGSSYTSDIVVRGVKAGDVVTAYELVDSVVGSNNDKTTISNLTDYPSTDSDLATYVNDHSVADLTSAALDTKSVTATDSTVTFENLDDGAWLIVVTNGEGDTRIYKNTVVNNDAKVVDGAYVANPQTVDVKSTDTDVSKTIDGQSFQQGQSYDFTATFAVPSFPANATDKSLTVTDSPVGFTDDASTIVIKAGSSTLSEGSDYTVSADAAGGFTITFDEAYITANPNQELTLTYTAKLTDVSATNGSASNHITVNDSDSNVTVTTYGVYFQKVDESGDALSGATFTLYEASSDGSADTSKPYGSSTSDENGYVYFSGLAAGKSYVAVETGVPAGKQKASDVSITIDAQSATQDNPATTDTTENNYQQSADVTDPNQGILPQTGAGGTLGITTAGVVLIAGGAAVVLRSRKRSK